MHYLFVICGVFSALFFLLLLTKAEKQKEHWFLAVIFFLITVNCVYVFAFSRSAALYYVKIFSELNYAIPLLYGPLLWFYTKALITEGNIFERKHLIHFLPFIVFLSIILVPVFSSYSLPTTSQLGYPLIKLIQAPFYLFAVLFILYEYRKKLNETYSYEVEVNLIWLNWITLGALILWIIGTISYIFNLFNEQDKILLYDYYTLSFLSFYLFALAYVAMNKTDLFYKIPHEATPQKVFVETVDNNIIVEDPESDNKDFDELLRIMKSKQPYLDPMLTLAKLAEISGIPSYRITRVLNESMSSNFYEFINNYRVEHVKELLNSEQIKNYSIMGIAEKSGFNSKASFNRIFKKQTGKTPSQYLKAL